ncbi:tyrosine-type recombinase/integrase [Lonepinella sp. BR2357]|uniref:tyrosine-type recombinase/integrase n=1 Tax=Lonepinella sp. BR2357 TaxID=3434549 RepID=UPI003F6DD102
MAVTVKPLTNTEVEKSKSKDKDYSLSDGNGLFLFVRSNGSKLWRFQYYKPFSKRRTIISLGRYPELSLADARRMREEYRALLVKNIDPLAHNAKITEDKIIALNNSFRKVAEDWFRLRENAVKLGTLKKITHDDTVRRIKNHLFPLFGDLPITEITAPLAIEKFKQLEKDGKLDTLHRLIGYLNSIMVHAVNHCILQYNPTADIGRVFVKQVTQNNPTLPPSALSSVLQQIQSSNLELKTKCAIEFTLLTSARVGTVTQAEWSEIDWDNQLWQIPKAKMKGRAGKVQDFTLPLSRQSIHLLRFIQKLSGHSNYIFPSDRRPNEPMARDTPNKALQRIGFQNKLTAHGLRAMFSTYMNEQEFNPEIIEICLAHFEYSTVRGAYNKARYLEQRVEYMQHWGDFVESQASGKSFFCE